MCSVVKSVNAGRPVGAYEFTNSGSGEATFSIYFFIISLGRPEARSESKHLALWTPHILLIDLDHY